LGFKIPLKLSRQVPGFLSWQVVAGAAMSQVLSPVDFGGFSLGQFANAKS